MGIPKTIHYCWFGFNAKPALAKKCIKSWKKKCPDYQIIEWNEDNFDISQCPLYVRQAYEEKQWAFVTDYVRLKIIYEYGGIYLDTDVELKKSLNSLLEYEAYFGFEDGVYINTGLGFGANIHNQILYEMMEEYENISFIQADGSFDKMPCPQRNTEILLKHGLVQNDSWQVIDKNILILPSIYLCPLSYNTQKMEKSKKTLSIHWFSASWKSKQERKDHRKRIRKDDLDYIIHTPNRVLKKILGEKMYSKLKKKIKG